MILKNTTPGAKFLLPVLFLFIGTITSCSKKETKAFSVIESHGQSVYMANCTACHNPDPSLVGSIGPDVANSSIELITAKVLHQTYPTGYKPKRNSGLMPALPFLEKEIPALHAYLNSFKKP